MTPSGTMEEEMNGAANSGAEPKQIRIRTLVRKVESELCLNKIEEEIVCTCQVNDK